MKLTWTLPVLALLVVGCAADAADQGEDIDTAEDAADAATIKELAQQVDALAYRWEVAEPDQAINLSRPRLVKLELRNDDGNRQYRFERYSCTENACNGRQETEWRGFRRWNVKQGNVIDLFRDNPDGSRRFDSNSMKLHYLLSDNGRYLRIMIDRVWEEAPEKRGCLDASVWKWGDPKPAQCRHYVQVLERGDAL